MLQVLDQQGISANKHLVTNIAVDCNKRHEKVSTQRFTTTRDNNDLHDVISLVGKETQEQKEIYITN